MVVDRHVFTRSARALPAPGRRRVARGIHDPIDALAVADARAQNRLRRRPHELDPAARGLARLGDLDRLAARPTDRPVSMVVRIAIELVADIRAFTVRATGIERESTTRSVTVAPRLSALPGCGALTAAKIRRETTDVTRFRSDACFTKRAGVAPIPASSGRTTRHLLGRGWQPAGGSWPGVLPAAPCERTHHDGSPPRPESSSPVPGRVHSAPIGQHHPAGPACHGGLTQRQPTACLTSFTELADGSDRPATDAGGTRLLPADHAVLGRRCGRRAALHHPANRACRNGLT